MGLYKYGRLVSLGQIHEQLDFYGILLCSLANIYSNVIYLLLKGGSLYKISDNGSFWIVRCLGFDSYFKKVCIFFHFRLYFAIHLVTF